MSRLNVIDIRIPNLSKNNNTDNKYLLKMFSQLRNFRINNYIESILHDSLIPQIKIRPASVSSPQISFVTDNPSDTGLWHADEFIFGFNLPDREQTKENSIVFKEETLSDQSGEYTMLSNRHNTYYVLTVKQLLDRFNRKLVELNHCGMNLGPRLLANQDYIIFRNRLAKMCNMYKYPTGEEWPFIIPSSNEEFADDIKDDTINRNPKFELVFSEYVQRPTIQFDIETNLTKNDVLRLLPEPYGISLEGLEDFIRTVFIHIDWGNTILRFDLRFKSKGKDVGYWIIKEGSRYP